MTGMRFDMSGNADGEKLFCKACNEAFSSRRSLHCHIKVHGMTLGDYYSRFFPRFDKHTLEPIPFKTFDQYISSDFRHKKNMYSWLEKVSNDEAVYYCISKVRAYIKEKGLAGKFAPNYLYLLTHPRLPKMRYVKRFADWEMICKDDSLKLVQQWGQIGDIASLKASVPPSITIAVDTREQTPLDFDFKHVPLKLDFGDYTLTGKDYSYFYVDRKAESDFKGTMSAGFERFCRELERARTFGAYIFIVIESDMRKIYAANHVKFKKVNLDYTWENMRKIIINYSDVCQFVFTGSREKSSELIPILLFHGDKLKGIDLQEKIDEDSWLG